jgi:hypothetical protein
MGYDIQIMPLAGGDSKRAGNHISPFAPSRIALE